MSAEDDTTLSPPDAGRVAARALVLSAVSYRGLIEKDSHKPGAEELRQRVLGWLAQIGVAEEMEPAETTLLSAPLGKLDRKSTIDASWKSEGVVVLAWALHYATTPRVHVECDPPEIANHMGFLEDRADTPLHSPRLRDSSEIETWADTYLTLHWRLRQFSSHPGSMNFVNYVSACTWGPLRLDHLEILDGDLAIDGVPIDKVEHTAFRNTLSIAQERHQAFNWLLGFEHLYSAVTTDT
jgi:hypothetical protein